jgi:hypothetical protein
MTNITVSNAIENISVIENTDIISVEGDINFTLVDATEIITVSNVDDFIVVEESNTNISVVDSDETITPNIVTELLDFTSSEPVIVNHNTYEIETYATTGIPLDVIDVYKIVTSVLSKLVHADNLNLAHETQVLGISLNSGMVLDTVSVLTTGSVTHALWNWTPDIPLFLGTDGQMTETRPATGFLLQVAHTISPTEIWVDIKVATSFVSSTYLAPTLLSNNVNNQIQLGDDGLLFVTSVAEQEYEAVSPFLIYQAALL